MLEKLFGSASRGKIIKFFCTNDRDAFFVRELSRRLDIKLNALSRELANLENIGFLQASSQNNKKYFRINPEFPLLPDLKALILKSTLLLEKAIVKDLDKIKGIQVFVLTGIFVGQETGTDILLVGSIKRSRIEQIIKKLSKSFYQDLRFTVFKPSEYRYRLDVTDKFLHGVFSSSPIVIFNRYTR